MRLPDHSCIRIKNGTTSGQWILAEPYPAASMKHFFCVFFLATIILLTSVATCFSQTVDSGGAVHFPDTVLLVTDSVTGKTGIDTSRIVFTAEDIEIFYRLADSLIINGIAEMSAGEAVIGVAMNFLDCPYTGHTLERDIENKLVINLRGFDCVTFVETTLAMARILMYGKNSFIGYARELQNIRYRNGEINEFPSRLHYFTDWLFDNEHKGIISDITAAIDSTPYDKTINFMTKNRSKYAKLSDDRFFNAMEDVEKEINTRDYYYIPKSRIGELSGKINSGDVLLLTTDIEGLDISHVGFALWIESQLYLLHASSYYKKVIISTKPLVEYIAANKKQSGVMVARLMNIKH
ncbi:MAG: DUF1460 domain-containing protein [Bacteroidetes bacterium]|nr:DUF1460 domain-containing protein [Bacteroidota bacterium]